MLLLVAAFLDVAANDIQPQQQMMENAPLTFLVALVARSVAFLVAGNISHIIRRKSIMINIDSKNALSMMKFDMEIAKTQYFDIAKRCWRLSCM